MDNKKVNAYICPTINCVFFHPRDGFVEKCSHSTIHKHMKDCSLVSRECPACVTVTTKEGAVAMAETLND